MSSTVNSNNQQPTSAPAPKLHMSSADQLVLLEKDLRAQHEQLRTITRPDLDDDPTPSPIEAMRMYAGSGNALRLNRYLRGQRSARSEGLRRMNEGMLTFFDNHSRALEASLTMRRWVFTEGSYSPALLAPGTTITERGWLSVTPDSFHGFFSLRADVECEIALPVGARVLGGSAYEREFILRPGSTFEVRKVVDTKTEVDGKKKFLVQLILL